MKSSMKISNQLRLYSRVLSKAKPLLATPHRSFMRIAPSKPFSGALLTGKTSVRMFSSYPDHIKLEMPNLSPTMEKGNIGTWYKQEGDKIEIGDVLCSIETDKATVDFEMQEEGYIAKILYPAGAKDIDLGKVLAVLVEEQEDIAKFADFAPEQGAPQASAPAKEEPAATSAAPSTPAASAQPSVSLSKPSGSRQFVSPLAKNMAEAHGVNLAGVTGTGPRGRIIRADVEEALQAGPASAAPISIESLPASSFVDLPNSQIRKVIADRLTYSKQNIPHYYVSVQVQVDNLLKLRSKLNKFSTSKISVNDLVMKAAAHAAIKVPATNSSWMDDFIR